MLAALVPAGASALLRFTPQRDYGVDVYPVSVVADDVNGDGKQDLVTSNAQSDRVSVLLGDGAGLFASPTTFGVGSTPGSLAIGDFNGDGKRDLAIPNFYSNNVSVLLGTGTGSFGTLHNFNADSNPVAVAIGDFNGDSKQDLAVANMGAWVSILLGKGDGTFETATNTFVGGAPCSIVVGDFNSDGKQDLAVSGYDSGKVSILVGSGNGLFTVSATNYTVGAQPLSVALGDFNGDGRQDLVTANVATNNVSVLLGQGAATFGAKTDFSVGENPQWVSVGDINGDGKQDLVTANWTSGDLSVLLGTDTGSFGAASSRSVGTHPTSVAIGDFNGDGARDLAASTAGSSFVSVLLSSPSADPSPTTLTFGSAGSPIRPGTISAPQTVTVTNNGSAPLLVSKFTTGGGYPGDFTTENSSCTGRVAPGSSCTVQVRFAPKAQGSRSASLSVISNAPDSTEIELTGIAHAAATGKIVSAKLTKTSFSVAEARSVKLNCKFSPKSKAFRYVLSLKKGKKRVVVTRVGKTGLFTNYSVRVKALFAGKSVRPGSYRLNLSADTNSRSLGFKVT